MVRTAFGPVRQIDAGVLDVGYVEVGPADGQPVVLLHGWPYDIHSYADVAPALGDAGYRVVVPYLRGYGTTCFLSDQTPTQRPTIGPRPRRDQTVGRGRHRHSHRRRLRLGSTVGQHRRPLVARTLQSHGVGERLPDRESSRRHRSAAATGRTLLVVSVLLRHGTRSSGARQYCYDFAKLIWHTASPHLAFRRRDV